MYFKLTDPLVELEHTIRSLALSPALTPSLPPCSWWAWSPWRRAGTRCPPGGTGRAGRAADGPPAPIPRPEPGDPRAADDPQVRGRVADAPAADAAPGASRPSTCRPTAPTDSGWIWRVRVSIFIVLLLSVSFIILLLLLSYSPLSSDRLSRRILCQTLFNFMSY